MPSAAPITFARDKRIQKRRDFLHVQRHGVRSFGRFVVAIAQRSHENACGKLGITVPKKVGPAHVRNKIKRRIRHILRLNQDAFFEKFLVIIAKESSEAACFSDLSQDILQACRRFKHQTKATSFRPKNNTKSIA
jgi:ribonuclease P protein component